MNGNEHGKDGDAGDMVAELLRHAAVRRPPPAAAEQAIRAALRDEWRALTGRRRRRRAVFAVAAAAAIVLAVGMVARQTPSPAPSMPAVSVASVERLQGEVSLGRADGGTGETVQAGARVQSGQSIVTNSGSRVALLWRDGSALRVDQNTRLRLTADGEVELQVGRVYVDTAGARPAAGSPVILTPAGPVRHLGTQYMAAVAAGVTRVSVREGTVAVARGGGEERAAGGQQLIVEPGGAARLQPIPVHGAAWQWAEALAAPYASGGRSLADFLGWVGRETGRRVEYASTEAARVAASAELRGEVELEPMRALEAVVQTSDLLAEVDDGIITVRLRSGE
jgi:ferric-dicitrate binding protein FerR (iron transport regulator)